jgi:phosphoglycolate phosphatase-like HAD superfamily hydrolase
MQDTMGRRRKLILFDLDGTLIVMKNHTILDSSSVKPKYHSLWRAMKEGAIEAGLPEVEYEGFDRMALIWNKTREILDREKYPEGEANAIMKKLDEILFIHEAEEHERGILQPGVLETFEYLKEAGYYIGIVTSTSERELLKIMEKFCFKKYIDRYVTRDQVRCLKPHPEPFLKFFEKIDYEEFMYVGDSDHDAEAVERANRIYGLKGVFILINTRKLESEKVDKMKPLAVIDSIDETLKFIDS